MDYLKKTDKVAISHVAAFIDSNWLEQNDKSLKYQNIGYSDIKNPADKFREFFVVEQRHKCCYCCRQIENNHTTELEHIIPRTKNSSEEFLEYYNLSAILKANVVPQAVFESTTAELLKPPFPHHIAYQNIVASCNGSIIHGSEKLTCCNRERKDTFIPPFNLMEDCISYLNDGTIVYKLEPTNRSYFDVLNLNKELLVNIRRLWYLFSISDVEINQITNAESPFDIKEMIIRYAFANSKNPLHDIKLVQTFSNEQLWGSFLKYSYFFHYYRKNV